MDKKPTEANGKSDMKKTWQSPIYQKVDVLDAQAGSSFNFNSSDLATSYS